MKIVGLSEFWSILRHRHRRELLRLIVLQFGLSVLEFVAVGAVPAYVLLMSRADEAMHLPQLRPWLDRLGIHDVTTLIFVAGAAVIGLFLVRGAFNVWVLKVQTHVAAEITGDLSRRLFAGYLHAPYLLLLTRNTSHLVHLTMDETQRIANGYLVPLLNLFQALLIAGALILLVLVADPFMALMLAAVAGGGCLLFLRLNRERLHRFGREFGLGNKLMTQTLNEGLGSIKHTRLRGLEADIDREFSSHVDRRERAQRALRFSEALSKPAFETIGLTGIILLVFAMLLQGRPLDLIVPTLAMLGAVAVRMLPTLNQIAANLSLMRSHLVPVSALVAEFHTLGLVGQDTGADAEREVPPFAIGDIEFEGVSFRYPGQSHDTLHAISLTIPAGSSVAFVGPTGSGKTTVVDVMLGFLDHYEGDIRVGGRSIRENMAGWQRLIGYIPQTIYLTDASIRRNVALGVPESDIDDAAVWRALEAAQLAEYVRSLPDGLETSVGERGIRLSGGQRQRIGIARALYYSPQLLVLDEATAALDNATEQRLMSAIEQAKSNRTLVMIAHRLSTIRNCDRIFFIGAGRVLATGTFEELMQRSAEFRAMVNAEPAHDNGMKASHPSQ